MTTPIGASPEARRSALTRLAIAMVLTMTTWFSATAVLGQLRIRWDLDSSTGSWLTIAVQLGFVVGALVLAVTSLSDVIAPRTLIFVGALGASAANLGLLAADGAGTAIVLRAVTGAFLAAVYPPAMKSISTWYREDRGVALGVMVGALTIGSASPHLVDFVGTVPWQIVIVVTSAATLLGGALARWWALDGPYPFPRAQFDIRLAVRSMAPRGVRLATLGYFGHMWELRHVGLDRRVLHRPFDSARVGSLLAFVVIGVGAAGSVAGGHLGDRRGRSTSTVIAMVSSGSMAATIGFVGDRGLVGDVVVIAMGVVWGSGSWPTRHNSQPPCCASGRWSVSLTRQAEPDDCTRAGRLVRRAIPQHQALDGLWPSDGDHRAGAVAVRIGVGRAVVGITAACPVGHGHVEVANTRPHLSRCHGTRTISARRAASRSAVLCAPWTSRSKS